MKKTPTTRRVNTNPTFSIPDNSKISPKSSSLATNAYFLRNPKVLQPTTARPDLTNKTHSPRHIPSASSCGMTSNFSSQGSFLSGSTSATHQNQQLKTSRAFQSPVQKSPSYYLLKGKNSEMNPDFNGGQSQARNNCSPISPDNSRHINRKNSNSEYYPISLSIHFNGDKRQSVTPNTKNTNYSVQYYPTPSNIAFTATENTTRGSHEYEKEKINFSKIFTENMKPDSEPVTNGVRRQLPESHALNKAAFAQNPEKRVLTELDLNSLGNTDRETSNQLGKFTYGYPLTDSKGSRFDPLNIQIDDSIEGNRRAGGVSERLLCRSQESDREQPVSQRMIGICLKHTEKKGKYYLQSESDPDKVDYYCSKCAVDLALKGIKAIEIKGLTDSFSSNQRSIELENGVSPKNAMNHIAVHSAGELEHQSEQNQPELLRDSLKFARRNEELTGFIGRLEELLQRMKSLKNGVDHEKIKAVNSYRSEKENIELFCKQLVSKIYEHKENICRSLDIEQSELVQQYDLLAKTPLRHLSEISQIKGDIEENLQNIMKNIEDKPYKRIMQKYEERLELYENYLKEKEIALTQQMIPPKCRSTLEELKKRLKDSISAMLGATGSLQGKNALLNLGDGDFEGFLRCDEEISEMPLQSGSELNAMNLHPQKRISNKNNLPQNYMLVSFENKDLFQNALNTSKDNVPQSDSLIYETVPEHEDECIEGVNIHSDNQKPSADEASEDSPNDDASLTFNRKNSITRSSRYDENLKK